MTLPNQTGAVHLAQINIGTMVAPTDDPMVAEFMDNLDRINALADDAPGFVWRLQTEAGNATAIQIFPDPLELVNMSVWTSVEALKAYVYRSEHVAFFRRRAEWFVPEAKRVALWWVAAGEVPDLANAVRRAEFRQRYGSSPYAFGFADQMRPLVFEPTSPVEPDTADLVNRLNAELAAVAVDPSENHFDLAVEDVSGDAGRMVRARYDGQLVGCGAVRRIGDGVGELKRMFVDPEVRGQRIGAALLDQLEGAAMALGLGEVRLETGVRQSAALGLYQAAGYTPIEPWGEYRHSAATSRCFAKVLSSR